MVVIGEGQVTGENGRNPSGRKVLIFFGYRRFLARCLSPKDHAFRGSENLEDRLDDQVQPSLPPVAFLPVEHLAGVALALHRRCGQAQRLDGRGIEVNS